MSKVFIIKNQDDFYLTRQNEWNNGSEAALLFKTPHHDIALNTLIELNSKDIHLRGVIMEVETSDKGLPIVEVIAQAQMSFEQDSGLTSDTMQDPEIPANNDGENLQD
jgi:hypothetical protein